MKIQTSYLNAIAQAIVDDLAGGKIRLYSDPVPDGPATAITTQTLIAELGLPNPAGTVSNGEITFGTITPDSNADATGAATWARFLRSDGTTAVFDALVGPGLDLDGISSITSGQTVAIDSLLLTGESL